MVSETEVLTHYSWCVKLVYVDCGPVDIQPFLENGLSIANLLWTTNSARDKMNDVNGFQMIWPIVLEGAQVERLFEESDSLTCS